jgi:xanthine dehydrogenase molybdenum-binding subunit
MSRFHVIGKKVQKVDAFDKVTGRAVYGHDLKLPGMLYGKILRSRHPHAHIRSIDTRRARKVPGVRAVITGFDRGCGKLGFLQDHPVLKTDRVRSLRDEVAAVAAVSEEAAEEAVEKIRVRYEPLPAVFDPFEAMAEGAPRLHEHAPDNRVKFRYRFEEGEAERALDTSAHTVEGTFRTHNPVHCCMETCFVLASSGPGDALEVWSSTQIPYLMQNTLGRVLKIPAHKIRIRQPVIGGAFGSKLDVYPYEIICILLARETGRPVRITFTREEEFLSAPTRQPMVLEMAAGCDADGRLTARKLSAVLDNGAYTSWGATTPHIMLLGITSLYKVPHISFQAQSVYTNNFYAGAFRGYGNPQGTFANEQLVDELARKVGMDPVAFRLLNANTPDSVTPQNFRITTCGLPECLTKAADAIGLDAPKAPYEGVGFASMFHVGGGGRVYKSDGCGVIARLDDFGRLSVLTGATEIGTGSDTAMAMIAAETLGLELDAVSIINNDTDVGPWDVGIHASRMTFIGGNAVREACEDIRRQLAEIASARLGADPDDLEFVQGTIRVRSDPSRAVDIPRVVRGIHFREKGKMMVGRAFYDPPNEFQGTDWRGNVSSTYAFATHAVRLRVDPGTGKVRILKFVAVHDVGRALNPLGLEGQIHGAVAQGLGYALTERLQFDKGKLLSDNFTDYKMFLSRDMPDELEVHYVETDDPEGPFGAKGVSEAGLIPIPAAVANALADALGTRFNELPITPDKILAALRGESS